jgi:endoglucanase
MQKPLLAVLLWAFAYLPLQAQKTPIQYGINMCGGEFGESHLPGTLNLHYSYPTNAEIDYFYKKGFRLIDLPFKWERVQRSLGGQLDNAEMGEIRRIVAHCQNLGIGVILSMHNFGRYTMGGKEFIIGGSRVSKDHLGDFWRKMATEMRHYKNLYAYDIMNEPHHMGSFKWFETAQAVINAIRQADVTNQIMIAGDNYARIEQWAQYSDVLKDLKDPSNKIIYDAHCYFDIDYSGRYKMGYDDNGIDEYIGVRRAKPFIDWLKANNKKGFIGEFGVPDNDPRWLKALDVFMRYISESGISGNYWAGGHMWDNEYTLALTPKKGKDRPQMSVMSKYTNVRPVSGSVFVASMNAIIAGPQNSNATISTVAVAAQPQPAKTAVTTNNAVNTVSAVYLPGTTILPANQSQTNTRNTTSAELRLRK